MANKKIPEKDTFNLKLAHFMADDYLRMADRSIKAIPQRQKDEKTASICLAISSLAFAMEIYLKSILFSIDERTEGGHDLAKLWKRLPAPIKDWLSQNFVDNFDSENEKWTYIVFFSPHLRGLDIPTKIKMPDFTAYGIIKGHRDAFRMGRYAFERPPGRKLKTIIYNLNGLKILSWLIRELAHHSAKAVEEAKKSGEGEDLGAKISVTVKFPENIGPFPTL